MEDIDWREYSCLASGIVLNHVKEETEKDAGKLFAEYTGVPLAAILEESRDMRVADYQKQLFTELFPDGKNTVEIKKLLKRIETSNGELVADTEVKGLSNEELENFRKRIFENGWIV